ncbi:EscU/YscU/HrcU family type III secretion system export apparatus switch protein [Nocardioides massiliensis]|uniref:Flagellar biosynthetic protein FlhB n=1 Tax=Nocardioides massiliensis TaxID=1325935 RepID=A0ABT9NMP8_9ACTN|nr:EscU/YscU/HrcU family type III secretion system export apparatus switch protein [Nocardioides massiliensis]MDP9821694.1 flagellar biosynthetic protein FlhB [Nocardioides massiliensis]
MAASEEKTEKPTTKKKKESKKEGQVARTPDLGGWSALLLAAIFLPSLVGREIDALRGLMARALLLVEEPDVAEALQLLDDGLLHTLFALVLLGSGVLVIGVAGALAQGGFYLATKSMKPKLSKLDPIKGAKRIFGLQALWEGVKVLIRSVVVAVLGYAAVRSMLPLVGGFVPVHSVLDAIAAEATQMVRVVAVAGVVMAAADYAFKRRQIGKQTRMSKHEVKQEHKQTEGDPLVKSAIRARQMSTARQRMIADVPTADVLLVNPTHVAVALRYDPEHGAPRVVAKGAGVIAARIREIAQESRVPLVEDVPLTRALHRSCEVGQEIPAELFAAVAQILAFVISRKTQGHGGGRHRSPRAETVLPTVPPAGRRRRRTPTPT